LASEEFLDVATRNVKKGSARALQQLICALWPELFRYAAREFGDLDLAEDVVQSAVRETTDAVGAGE